MRKILSKKATGIIVGVLSILSMSHFAHASTIYSNIVSGSSMSFSFSDDTVYKQYVATGSGDMTGGGGIYVNLNGSYTSGAQPTTFAFKNLTTNSATTTCGTGLFTTGMTGVQFIACGDLNFTAGDVISASVGGGNPSHSFVSDSDQTFPYFVLVDSGGADVPDYRTRIVSVTPADNAQIGDPDSASAYTVDFATHIYINADDVGNFIKIRVNFHNRDQNVLFSPSSPYDFDLFFGVATTTGDWYFASSTVLVNGNYSAQVNLDRCLHILVGCAGLNSLDYKRTQFTVGKATFLGTLAQQTVRDVNSILGSVSATTTTSAANTCNPLNWFGSSTSPLTCLAFLFVPDTGAMQDVVNNLKDNVVTRFPLGYISSLASILLSTSTSDLTVIDATLPAAFPFGGGVELRLDLNHVLDQFLYATSSQFTSATASSTETFYDITSYYWKIIVYIGMVLYMVRRLTSSSLIPTADGGEQVLTYREKRRITKSIKKGSGSEIHG